MQMINMSSGVNVNHLSVKTVGKRKHNDDMDTVGDADDENSVSDLDSPFSYSVKRLKSLAIGPPKESVESALTLPRTPHEGATLVSGNQGISREQMVDKILPSLEHQQLLRLVQQMLAECPEFKERLTAILPKPTLALVRKQLEKAEKVIYAAFPYARDGPDCSDYSFNRVRASIESLHDGVVYYLDYFTLPAHYGSDSQHEFPANAYLYLQLCTDIIHRLPNWNNPQHTAETKHPLYTLLASQWLLVTRELCRQVKHQGRMFSADVLRQWYTQLHAHVIFLNHQFQSFDQALILFKQELGTLIGLNPSPLKSLGSKVA